MTRIFGFEIMPAPYVIAHWQMGLLLQLIGAPFSDNADERAGIYLTNALTGWEPPTGAKKQIALYPEFTEEREAAAHVKRDVKILVVLGNPPYNGFAGTAMEEERDLVKAYRKTRKVRAPEGQGLNDLYVRFYRMAERRIVEATGRGIVCFISNYSWLDGLSFTGMRERYLEVFDGIWIDCLNGDKYKTGKLTPEGEPDPSIFSTERNPEGIQVGTAIALLVRSDPHNAASGVRFRHLWGRRKREMLLETAEQDAASLYTGTTPSLDLGLAFAPMVTTSGYVDWPKLPELFPTSFPGVKTSRDDFLVDIDREHLLTRLRAYFDPGISNDEIRQRFPTVMQPSGRFDPEATRARLLSRGLLEKNVVPYCYRPFDIRWVYWESETKLLG
jgi:predicted helicase